MVSVIFAQPFNMSEVLHGFKNRHHVMQYLTVDWLSQPFGPIANVYRIGTAGDGRGNVRMLAGKLQSKFCDIDTMLRTVSRRLTSGRFYGLGFL